MKRLFDFSVALFGLIALSPVLVLITLLIKLTSPGPVLFCQKRVGRCFQNFLIYKFRTMVPDAEKLGGQLTAGRDPRITTVGRFLRKTKMDEFPQLMNVLKGEMSFVGPRPEVPRYVEMFRDEYADLLQVRPGITDLASLEYRHESELLGAAADPESVYVREILPHKIRLSREYLRRSSLSLDLWLIVRTVCRMTH